MNTSRETEQMYEPVIANGPTPKYKRAVVMLLQSTSDAWDGVSDDVHAVPNVSCEGYVVYGKFSAVVPSTTRFTPYQAPSTYPPPDLDGPDFDHVEMYGPLMP